MTFGSTPEQLERAFRNTEAGGGSGQGALRRRLFPESGLDVFTEVRFPSREWALQVRGDERLVDRDIVLASGLTCRTRDGSIEVVAGPDTERLLFCTLLADLINQLTIPDDAPAAALARRLTAWQRMLSRGLQVGLTPEARIGLYGELLVLREVMLPAIGADAVRAWVGPAAAAQDFIHLGTAIEVKTVSRRDPGRCRISDERQLETNGLGALFLVHQVVAMQRDGSGIADLVDELRDDPRVRVDVAWFENSLLEAGWLDVHRSRYAHERYALTRRRCFSIRDGFPRLVPAEIPEEVSAVSYLLDLSTCGSYRVDEETVRNFTAAGALTEG